MDDDYSNIEQNYIDNQIFKQSLFVITSIISINNNYIIVDAGTKSIDQLCGPPRVIIYKDNKYEEIDCTWINGGDEHGIILINNNKRNFNLNNKLLLITSHCDPTVNLYNKI
jgi:D-serine deaminase-like pyridoxal phosphate-dependent protein